MRGMCLAVGGLLALGFAGSTVAQADVIAERRAGLRAVGATLEAVQQTIQARGDTRALVARIDQQIAFYQTFPTRFPVASLTLPVAQGTQEGQTRALAVIDTNRAGFELASANMVTALTTLKTAAEAGSISTDLLRATGGTCSACHRQFQAR